MEHFLDTVETIPEGFGFPALGLIHFCWLAALGAFIAGSVIGYRRLDAARRKKMRRLYAVLLLANELFKMVCLAIGGNYLLKYLPLHLCSINIFVIAFHAWKPLRAVGDYLYLVCIPAAAAALLSPTWATLPQRNFMVWHSFTVHALLVAYPLMLTIGGDIRPKLRNVPRSLLVLAGLGCVALVVNLVLDTNFMFLMYAEPGTPFVFFEEALGHYLTGFFILVPAVLAVMMLPILLADARQKRAVRT